MRARGTQSINKSGGNIMNYFRYEEANGEDALLDSDWYESWDDDQEEPVFFLNMKETMVDDDEAPPPLFSSTRRDQAALNADLDGVTIVGGDFRKHSYSFMNITNCDLSFCNFRQANLI